MKTQLNSWLTIGAFAATIACTSCGNSSTSANGEAAPAEETANDEDMQKKMNVYVDAINSVSKNLNGGLKFYLRYVDDTAALKPTDNPQFMQAIQDADAKLANIQKVSAENPKAEIDQYAADYVAKAKAALQLHNELANYYKTKENLTDQNAKGIAKHSAYVNTLKEFKIVADKMFATYDHYYKAGNAKYIAKLEKDGDHIRAAGNKLMNEAEAIEKAFYEATPSDQPLKMNEALESVMARTANLQKLIDTYNNAVNAIPKETFDKRFLGYAHNVRDFGNKATEFMTAVRTLIAYLKKDDSGSIDHYYKEVGSKYDDLIDKFNYAKL